MGIDWKQEQNRRFVEADDRLEISVSQIEISLKKGEIAEGRFEIKARGGVLSGHIYASSRRIQIETAEFAGSEAEVTYFFDSIGMEEGESFQGELVVVSNLGEYELPFRVTIPEFFVDSSIGEVRNLFHFTNLAKANWREAVSKFYHPEFIRLFQGSDRQFLSAYRGLSYERNHEKNMDEFLTYIHKKKPVTFEVKESSLLVERDQGILGEEIHITKNGWGYTSLEVNLEGEFLFVEKEVLNEDAFLGNQATLRIYIDCEKLHAGNNFGRVHLKGYSYKSFVNVKVWGDEDRRAVASSLQRKKQMVELTRGFIEFRLKKVSMDQWMEKTSALVKLMSQRSENDCLVKLIEAQLCITRERYQEAKWILDQVQRVFERSSKENELYSYYAYLTTLYNRDEQYVESVSWEMEEVYKRDITNWQVLWFLLFLKEEYALHPARRFGAIAEAYEGGAISPVLYAEALQVLNAKPALLKELNSFAIQLLHFAVRQEKLALEVFDSILCCLGRIKEYDEKLFAILKYGYQKSGREDILQWICTLLIKGNRQGEAYFSWYELGVGANLRITRLYEYYMMSIPLKHTGVLPRNVMMYFAYATTLDAERTAYLYYKIVSAEEQFPEMVKSYKGQMERFVQQQILLGHMNQHLSYLYSRLVRFEQLEEESRSAFLELLFMKEVRIKWDEMAITQIVVIQDKIKGEIRYPVNKGKGYPIIYSQEYLILLQDKFGNRYLTEDFFIQENLMNPKEGLEMVTLNSENLGINLYLCEQLGAFSLIKPEDARCYGCVIQWEQARNDYKKEIRTKLLHYYYERDDIRELDSLLEIIDPVGMDRTERGSVIKYLVVRGFYEKAYEWIQQFGEEGVGVKTLLRLLNRILEWVGEEANMTMLHFCISMFRKGRYQESILNYLVRFYEGKTQELVKIWQAAEDFYLETYYLCERLLGQMMRTGVYQSQRLEVYDDYVKQGAKSEIRYEFLDFCAMDYFFRNHKMEGAVFCDVMSMEAEGHSSVPARLALLKYWAEKKEELQDEEVVYLNYVLEEFLYRGIIFAFFIDFVAYVPALEWLKEQTMVEYHSQQGGLVKIHYYWENKKNQAEREVYETQEMPHMYGGIYVKTFLLFFAEKINYYITEEFGGVETMMEQGVLQKSDIVKEDKENRFSLLNDCVISNTLQDYDTLEHLMKEYLQKEYMGEQLFSLQ